MATLVIREPKPDEAEVLAELHLETWRETFTGIFPASAWGEEARAQRIRMWTAICAEPSPDWRTAVAEIDGHVVGFAHSRAGDEDPPPRDRQLPFIYLLASAHGSGAGQALLEAVLGDDSASLWALEDSNPRARAFYVRNGFRPDGARKPTGYPDGGDQIRMVR